MNFARRTVATTIGILALLAAASIAGCPAGSSPGAGSPAESSPGDGSPTAAPEVIFDNGNVGLVAKSPTAAATFTTQRTYRVTLIRNYHWNDGAGSAGVGTIALRDAAGTTYGPWPAVGNDGGGGSSKNLNWEAAPDTLIPPGTYTVIDSDPATWAQNAASNNAGMTHVEGVRVATSGDDGTSGDGTSGDGDADTNTGEFLDIPELTVEFPGLWTNPPPTLTTSGSVIPTGLTTGVRDPRSPESISFFNAGAHVEYTSTPRIIQAEISGPSAELTFRVEQKPDSGTGTYRWETAVPVGNPSIPGSEDRTYTVNSRSYFLETMDDYYSVIEIVPASNGQFKKTFTRGDGVQRVRVYFELEGTVSVTGTSTVRDPFMKYGDVLILSVTYPLQPLSNDAIRDSHE